MKLLATHEFNELPQHLGKPALRLFGTKRGFYLSWSDGNLTNYRAFGDAMNDHLSPGAIEDWLRGMHEAGHCLKRSAVGCGAIGSAVLYTHDRAVAEDLFALIGTRIVAAVTETADISNACFRRMRVAAEMPC